MMLLAADVNTLSVLKLFSVLSCCVYLWHYIVGACMCAELVLVLWCCVLFRFGIGFGVSDYIYARSYSKGLNEPSRVLVGRQQ